MAGNTSTTAFGVQDPTAMRAVAVISPNTRARGAGGFLHTVADQPIFPVPPCPAATGRWLVPDTRTFAAGVPTISTSAVGITINPPTSIYTPMMVVQPDPRIRST